MDEFQQLDSMEDPPTRDDIVFEFLEKVDYEGGIEGGAMVYFGADLTGEPILDVYPKLADAWREAHEAVSRVIDMLPLEY